MAGAVPFGLYPTPACHAAQRLSAGESFVLDAPVSAAGTHLFRRSLWLPLPAGVAEADALRLVASALSVRFSAASFTVETGSTDWFSDMRTSDNRNVRLEFVWPATVSRLHSPAGFDRLDVALHRADGEQVAEEPTLTGRTDTTLAPPWLGSPLVIRFAQPIQPNKKTKPPKTDKTPASKTSAAPASGGSVKVEDMARELKAGKLLMSPVVQSEIVPALTITGKPTSPRLRLSLEAYGPHPEVLLWQALAPGEHATADLPAGTLADEWASALEQVAKQIASASAGGGAPTSARLRLDIESDAPCTATLQQASFGLEADYALLDGPLRLDFDGARDITHPVPLGPLQPGAGLLSLAGLLDGGDRPALSGQPLPSGGRSGVLLEADRAVVQRIDVGQPAALAGLAFAWHPLSDRIEGTLRIFADGGNGPGAVARVEQRFSIGTEEPGWISVRWPPVDFQPQPLWVRIALTEGLGIWLADPADVPPDGWEEHVGAVGAARTPLGAAPACAWLEEPNTDATPMTALRFIAGTQTLEPVRAGKRFSLEVPATLLGANPGDALRARSASPARLIIESVHATVRLA